MTNTITILAIAVLAISVPSAFACSEENVQHWNEFTWTTSVDNFVSETGPTLTIGVLNGIIVEVDDSIAFSPAQIIADELNSRGYTLEDFGNQIQPDFLEDILVRYSTICKDGIMEVVGGMLLQPDSTAIFLAYGIANAIWIAPTMAGLAAGIYLTKNKWKR